MNLALACANVHRSLGEFESRVHVLRGIWLEIEAGSVHHQDAVRDDSRVTNSQHLGRDVKLRHYDPNVCLDHGYANGTSIQKCWPTCRSLFVN